jgi:hypothetical protein
MRLNGLSALGLHARDATIKALARISHTIEASVWSSG